MKQLFTIGALTLILASAAGAEKLTYSDLVMRLVDMEQLAVLPLRGETCQQASSYDRASKYDATTGKYVNWDANGDNAGVVREEDGKLVLAEIRGPGCITRMWSALADQGHVRIYLDGAKNPAVDLPFVSYFDGKTEPFNYPSLVHTVARGLNNYVPIPFQKSCKIVADKGWGAYYQFTYRTFPVGTIIPTFSMKLSANDKELLAKVNTFLTSGGGTDPSQMTSVLSKRWTNNYALGTAGSVTDTILGPRAIVAIKVELPELSAERYETLLREAVIQINWDGETYPSVLVPLGDFFGTAPGLNSYTSLPMSVKGQTLTSYWYMPFGKSATINLKCGAQAFDGQVKLEIHSQMLDKPIETYGRLHAKWHRDAFLPQSPERSIDWTMLTTQGRGRFVGTALEIWNPRGAWWGEGDEKFFADGEKFPSTFGTGSEDYFGYAWCDPTLFQNAYHNQTRNDGGNRGHVAVNRWHIADNIPFQTSFEGYIEKYFSNNRPTLYASTVYWYLEPGGRDPYGESSLKHRTDWYPQAAALKAAGALEGERLKVLAQRGHLLMQDMAGFGMGWSDDWQLLWTGGKIGDAIVLALPVERAGRYVVSANFTRAPDYAILQVSLNDKMLGDPLDLFAPTVVATGAMTLGTADLTFGDNRLKMEITGANPSAVKSYIAGLDYVKLTAFP